MEVNKSTEKGLFFDAMNIQQDQKTNYFKYFNTKYKVKFSYIQTVSQKNSYSY